METRPAAHIGLILASGSVYRRQLLDRLGIPFEVVLPEIDESAEVDVNAGALASRLARLKAQAVAARKPQAVIIGSDQVAECNGQQLGKPGTTERAIAQLEFTSGREVIFHTAVTVIAGQRELTRLVPTRVQMKRLSSNQIRAYVDADRPLDCAAAMKSESLGIVLAESIASDDPTALIGLPLIAVSTMLEELGVDILPLTPQPPAPR